MKNSFYGVASQIAFSGTNFLIGVYAISSLSAAEISVIAFVQALLLFMCMVIGALIVVPYNMTSPSSRSDYIASIRRIYFDTEMVLLIAITSAVIFLASFGTFGVTTSISVLIYSIAFLCRFWQRSFLIAESRNFQAFVTETTNSTLVAIILLGLWYFSVPLALEYLLLVVSLAMAPFLIINVAKISPIKIVFRQGMLQHFRKNWGTSGFHSLIGTMPSEVVNSGYIYVLTYSGETALLSNLYFASLIFRPVSVLFPSLRSTILPTYVKIVGDERYKLAAKITVTISAFLLVLVGIIWLLGVYFIDELAKFGADQIFDANHLLYWISVFGLINAFLALRTATFSMAQALKIFQQLSLSVAAAASGSVTLFVFWWLYKDNVVFAVAMLAPSMFFSCAILLIVWREIRKRSST